MENENKKSKIDYILPILGYAFVAAVVGIVIWAVVGMFSDTSKVLEQGKQTEVHTVLLQSVAVTSQTEGGFFLGCGSVSGEEYYVCYEVLDDGGLKLKKIAAKNTIIYQSLEADEQAYAEITVDGWGVEKEIKLYVPKDTVQVEYDLSLTGQN